MSVALFALPARKQEGCSYRIIQHPVLPDWVRVPDQYDNTGCNALEPVLPDWELSPNLATLTASGSPVRRAEVFGSSCCVSARGKKDINKKE